MAGNYDIVECDMCDKVFVFDKTPDARYVHSNACPNCGNEMHHQYISIREAVEECQRYIRNIMDAIDKMTYIQESMNERLSKLEARQKESTESELSFLRQLNETLRKGERI